MSLNTVTISGNLTGDPQVKTGENGKTRCIFSVAVNKGSGEDQQVSYIDITAFGTFGDNLAASLSKGSAVILSGELRSYTTKVATTEGEKSIGRLSLTAWDGGPNLRWATAAVTRNPRQDAGNGAAPPAAPPAASSAGSDEDF